MIADRPDYLEGQSLVREALRAHRFVGLHRPPLSPSSCSKKYRANVSISRRFASMPQGHQSSGNIWLLASRIVAVSNAASTPSIFTAPSKERRGVVVL